MIRGSSFSDTWINYLARSALVQRVQYDLAMVDEIILGVRLQHWLLNTAEELSPEFLALGVIEFFHLPHLCTPFLTASFHRLFRRIQRRH
jgi:hypothetical protein